MTIPNDNFPVAIKIRDEVAKKCNAVGWKLAFICKTTKNNDRYYLLIVRETKKVTDLAYKLMQFDNALGLFTPYDAKIMTLPEAMVVASRQIR